MSVEKGSRMFAAKGKAQPSVTDLVAARDHAGLSKRGGLGVGALRAMAGKGDRDAREALRALHDDALETGGDIA